MFVAVTNHENIVTKSFEQQQKQWKLLHVHVLISQIACMRSNCIRIETRPFHNTWQPSWTKGSHSSPPAAPNYCTLKQRKFLEVDQRINGDLTSGLHYQYYHWTLQYWSVPDCHWHLLITYNWCRDTHKKFKFSWILSTMKLSLCEKFTSKPYLVIYTLAGENHNGILMLLSAKPFLTYNRCYKCQ